MSRPELFGDIDYYPGDDLPLTFFFHEKESLVALNVSGLTFTYDSPSGRVPDALLPQLDTSRTGNGYLTIPFEGESTKDLPQFTPIAVKDESNLLDRTFLGGRLVRNETLTSGTLKFEPYVRYISNAVIIPVAIDAGVFPLASAWGGGGWGEFAWPGLQTAYPWGYAPWGVSPWGI